MNQTAFAGVVTEFLNNVLFIFQRFGGGAVDILLVTRSSLD
jgi:hypothetical protein